MTMQFREIAEQAAADGVISDSDILALRRAGWASGRIEPHEADAIFEANFRLAEPTREWSDFFVEALGHFIVDGIEPRGYVSEEQADWLTARIDHDGRLESITELELLVRLFERSYAMPQRLRDYALEQIERAVLEGEGVTRCGGRLEKGNVTEAEARLMRRIIFASASERPAAVSKREAELLFRIKDATLGKDNTPEWKRLFVQGVGNFLMGFTAHLPVSRERAAELDAFMNDADPDLGRFFGKVARHAARGSFLDAWRSDEADRGPTLDERVAQAGEVERHEQEWLNALMDANGMVDEFDRALLDFITEELQAR